MKRISVCLILLCVSVVCFGGGSVFADSFQDDMTEFMEERAGSVSEFHQEVTGEKKGDAVAPEVENKSVNTKGKVPGVFQKEPPRVELAYEMPGPVGEYLFSGSAQDTSGFGNHGIVNGALLTTGHNGQEDSAYIFYERPHRIKIPRSDANTFSSGSFTVSFWVRTIDEDARGQRMVSNDRGSGGLWEFRYASGRRVHFLLKNEYGESAFIVHSINDARWHQVTGVRNAEARTMSLYVDGRLIQTRGDVEGSVDSGGDIFVGDHKNLLFVGRLDEVRLWNVALDDRALAALHKREVGSPVTGMAQMELVSSEVPAPVALYPFDGNADDTSPHANHAQVNEAELVPDRVGNEERAYLFYERSHRIKIPLAPQNTFASGDFSASFWVRMVKTPNTLVGLLTNDDGTTPKWGFFSNNSGQVIFRLSNQEGESAFLTHGIADGRWHHILGTRKSRGNTMSLYVDGALVGSRPAVTGSVNSLGHVWVGDHRNRLFTGRIDEVTLWDRSLAQAQVAAVYTEASALVAEQAVSSEAVVMEPVGEYHFSGNGDDVSAYGNHAQVNAAHPAEDRFGNPESAYRFHERDNRIKIPLIEANTFARGSFTVSFWLNVHDPDNVGNKVVTNSNNHNPQWAFSYNQNGNLMFLIRNKENQSRFVSCPLDSGSWHHVMGVRNASANTLSLYVDGRHINTVSGVRGDVNSGAPIWVGEHTNRLFRGSIDDVVLWKRALSPEEIREMHAVNVQLAQPRVTPAMSGTINKKLNVPRKMPRQ